MSGLIDVFEVQAIAGPGEGGVYVNWNNDYNSYSVSVNGRVVFLGKDQAHVFFRHLGLRAGLVDKKGGRS